MASERHREKLARRIEVSNAKARQEMLDEEFNSIYKNRGRIYKTNFFRGIFFGLGTFIGGTIVVALVIGLLSWLGSTFHFTPFEQIVQDIQYVHHR